MIAAPAAVEPASVVRRAVAHFTSSCLVALALVSAGTVLLADALARDAAVREASTRTAAFARYVAAPLVDRGVRAGDGPGRRALDTVLRGRLGDGALAHIAVWASDGTLIWAEDARLIGRRFDLDDGVRGLFGTSRVLADYGEQEGPGPVLPADAEPLLQVSAAAVDADGVPLVVEWSWSTAGMRGSETAIRRRLLPLAVGSLLVFQLAVLPLAVSLGRQVDRARLEREDLLTLAAESLDLERRRITQDLHDGVIQDLTGLAYVLPSVAAQLPEAAPGRQVLAQVATVVQRDVGALRVLLTDLYPPDLSGEGLAAALRDLARQTEELGVEVALSTTGLADVSSSERGMAFRVVREGLRNVVKHAEATCAQVAVHARDGQLVVCVSDDGRGLRTAGVGEGHVGLRLLADAAADAGGELSLTDAAHGGARLRVSLPLVAEV